MGEDGGSTGEHRGRGGHRRWTEGAFCMAQQGESLNWLPSTPAIAALLYL